MPSKVKIIDTGLAVAKQVKSELEKFSLQSKSKETSYSISTNSSNKDMEKVIRSITTKSDLKFSYFDSWG